MKFKESKLAHKYCKGTGLEIGGSSHNPFGLDTKNVDFTKELTTFKKEEISLCGEFCPVDIEAPGDNIPLPDESQDFIISSHVLEHFPDPIKALIEWYRLVKKGGVIFMIVPHKERTFDSSRPRTERQELIDRHEGKIKLDESTHEHYSVWITKDVVELIEFMNANGLFPHAVTIEAVQDVDDKVGNGFTIVLRKNQNNTPGHNSSYVDAAPDISGNKTIEGNSLKTEGARQLTIGFIQANNNIDVQWYRPLVFGYLRAYLERDLSFPVEIELIETLKQIERFQVLAISSTSQNFASAISIARQAKQANRNIITILGGHHITCLHDTMTHDFDIGVIGEGEQTFLEIVELIQAGGCLPDPEVLCNIRGIVYWDNGRRVVTQQRPLIAFLDSLPHPFRVAEDTHYIFTSRGCPFRCSFCSSSAFWRQTRFFSAEYVIAEIEQLLALYPGISHIPILDDLFIANKKRLYKLIDMLETRNIAREVSFSFSVRANLINEEMCKTLTRLKIASVAFGAESGSDSILKLMNKNVTVAQNQNALDLLHKYKINTVCSFIVGWPTETEKEVKKTFEFITNNVLQNKLPTISAINILMPIPGTLLWDESVRIGKINLNLLDWKQLSVFADYQHSKLNSFEKWVDYRRQINSIYLAEDTLPQMRLYELMAEHYESMRKIQEGRDREKMKQDRCRRQANRFIKQIQEVEYAISEQETAIERWKTLRMDGQHADESALMASARFFRALFALVNEISASEADFNDLKNVIIKMTSCYQDMENVGKIVAASSNLDDVNKIIEEQLIPRVRVWPPLIETIIRDVNRFV